MMSPIGQIISKETTCTWNGITFNLCKKGNTVMLTTASGTLTNALTTSAENRESNVIPNDCVPTKEVNARIGTAFGLAYCHVRINGDLGFGYINIPAGSAFQVQVMWVTD